MLADTPHTTVPAPREEDWAREMHARHAHAASFGTQRLVFLGDSITDGWTTDGRAAWERVFAPQEAVAFGVGGDRTQHLLWRLQNGTLGTLMPEAFVVLIGTNNAWDDSAADIVAGIQAILRHLQAAHPDAKILLLGLLPRVDSPDWPVVMATIEEINRTLASLADGGETLRFLDLSGLFWQPYGHLPPELMPDGIHLSPQGYELLAEAITDAAETRSG